MANRKEDEKNERIIRNLLKLADNRRCINCNSLGPQYVCTNFWTFVCTACSGIHREFTHRVKSISMAKFTSQEVSALQGGGNARAKAIYFKEWDPQRNSVPDNSNIDRLRDFIKHVYVDRRFTGEKSFDKPPRVNMGETGDSNRSGSQSPPYGNSSQYSDRPSPGGRSDDRDFRSSYDERRSPGFDKISPARTEIVNDWRREDRFVNGKKSDDDRISDGRSPGRDSDLPSPPVVRPVREILGDNVSPLRIIEPPKANSGRGTDGFKQPQRTTSSSSLASSNGNPTEIKSNTLGSLIDFDDAPDPPKTAAGPQPQSTGSSQSVLQPTSSSADNWACFDSPAEKKVTQAPTLNTLDSLFSGSSESEPVSKMTMFPTASTSSESPFGVFPGGNVPPPAHLVSPLPPNGMNTPAIVANGGQRPTMPPQQYSGFPPLNNQPWSSSIAPVGPGALSIPAGQSLQAVARPSVEVAPGGVQYSSSAEVNKPIGRQALPEDLFAPTYPQFSVRPPNWQAGPPHGFAYNMPYNAVMPMQSFQQSSMSTNPFDFGNDLPPVQAPTFPSMASLQGALPNLAAQTNTSHNSQPWGPPQSSYPSAMPPQAQSFASPMPPSAYMGHQMPNNLFPGRGLSGEGAAHGPINPNQQLAGMFFPPATQNNFSSVGGNPFG